MAQSDRQQILAVGIMNRPSVAFFLESPYSFGGKVYCGEQTAVFSDGKVLFDGNLFDEVLFEGDGTFLLKDVTIGVDFHWERQEDQRYGGTLKLIPEGSGVTAVNLTGIEDYLLSVISSEMKATASPEFLKAHAVISRSWLLSQIENRSVSTRERDSFIDTPEKYVRWFDREDHERFDVCADDHCQRYQGLARATTETVRKVIDSTWGQVLTYDGKICDARFSKCCGGIMERFSTCWGDKELPYLQPLRDAPDGGDDFCNTSDTSILSQVLNDYDLETRDFYRWETRYNRAAVSELMARRSGIDFGIIKDLIPLERGASGRIKLLKVVGTLRTMEIGKELIIRRWLSESHLKSSAFDVRWDGDTLILTGKGWGHGVGLCQIGAAVMGAQGYEYKDILAHYFPGSIIEKRY